jgi:4-amino-4-deoxy-L-arabinose transferase-like glycosyltransferase
LSRPPEDRRIELAVLAGAVLLALALRVPLLGWGLPGVYEEAIPFWKAWQMWGWLSSWRFDLDPGFFRYPSLVIYLQWLGQALHFACLRLTGAARSASEFFVLFRVDPTSSIVIARAITTLFGVLTLWPAWALARRAAGPRAAGLAVLLLALHPVLIARSQMVEVDVPLAYFTTWGLLLAVRLAERPSARGALATGLVAGLATSSKYPGAMLLAPGLLAVWTAAGQARARERWTWTLLLGGGLAAAFFATSPYVLIDRAAFLRDLADERQHMAAGHFGLAGGPALGGYVREWFTGVMGWPLGVASLAGLGLFAVRGRSWALILAAFFVPYVAITGSWQMQAEHYMVPLVPIGVVAAAALAAEAAGARPASRWWAAAVMGAAALLLAGPLALRLPARYATLRTDTRTLAKRWIESHVPPGAMIVTEAYGPELFDPLEHRQLLWSPPEVRAALTRHGYAPPLYAVLDLPLFQVEPERSARFYSFGACSVADLVVVSSSVRDRYREAPARFGPQLAFYDSLEQRWARVEVFGPAEGPGPELVIYANPGGLAPFGARGDPGPVSAAPAAGARPTGAEPAYFLQLGLDYEVFGYLRQAEQCYRLALSFGRADPVNYVDAATWLVHVLWKEGRREEAVRLLDAAVARAPGPDETSELGALRAALDSTSRLGPPQP